MKNYRAPRLKRCFSKGFSLVEVTLALGIISFAFVAIFGLIPTGLTTFRKAIDTSVGSQIIQRVVADIQQADFDSLGQQHALRYFDDQGNEKGSEANPPSSAEMAQVIYHVNVLVATPAGMPGGDSSRLARVTVEIVNNPGNRKLERDASGSIQEAPNKGIFVSRYSAFVARNQ